MTVFDLSATVFLDGDDITAHVISIKRTMNFNAPPQQCEIELRGSFPGAGYLPYHTLTIDEEGTRVFTGFADEIVARRPSQTFRLAGTDRFKLAQDTFLEDQGTSGSGESTAYWLGYMCDLAGLSYTNYATGGSVPVGSLFEPMPLGLRSVAEALKGLCAGAKLYMLVNSGGSVEFHDARTLTSTVDVDYTITDRWVDEIIEDDQDVRTTAIVWGHRGVNAIVTRAVPGVSIDRRMLFAVPNAIHTAEQATALANAALDQFATLRPQARIALQGDPQRWVGDIVRVEGLDGIAVDTLTNFESNIDSSGYRQDLYLGRRQWGFPANRVYRAAGFTGGSTPVQFTGLPNRCTAVWMRGSHAYGWGSAIEVGFPNRYRVVKMHTSGSVAWNNVGTLLATSGFGPTTLGQGNAVNSSYMYTLGTTGGSSGIFRFSESDGSLADFTPLVVSRGSASCIWCDDEGVYLAQRRLSTDSSIVITKYNPASMSESWVHDEGHVNTLSYFQVHVDGSLVWFITRTSGGADGFARIRRTDGVTDLAVGNRFDGVGIMQGIYGAGDFVFAIAQEGVPTDKYRMTKFLANVSDPGSPDYPPLYNTTLTLAGTTPLFIHYANGKWFVFYRPSGTAIDMAAIRVSDGGLYSSIAKWTGSTDLVLNANNLALATGGTIGADLVFYMGIYTYE